jgi:hypothetical protein
MESGYCYLPLHVGPGLLFLSSTSRFLPIKVIMALGRSGLFSFIRTRARAHPEQALGSH